MNLSSITSLFLVGTLAYSSCKTIDPVRQKQIVLAVSDIKQGRFPHTEILKEDDVEEAIEDNLSALLSGRDWVSTINYVGDAGFIDEDDLASAVKKVLRSENAVVRKEGRIAEFLLRCRPNRYDIMNDEEGRGIVFELLRNAYHSHHEFRDIKTLLLSVPDRASEFVGEGIKRMIEEKEYDDASFLADACLADFGKITLSKQEWLDLARYSLGFVIEKGVSKSTLTKTDAEIAERLCTAGLSAEDGEKEQRTLASTLIAAVHAQLASDKRAGERVTAQEIIDHVWTRRGEHSALFADVLLERMHECEGHDRLEYCFQRGFRPSSEALETYCEEVLTNRWNFEDVLFFISKNGNNLPAEKYVHFAVRVLDKPRLRSEDVWYAALALEYAKALDPDSRLPLPAQKRVEELAHGVLDITSISRLISVCWGRNYWIEEGYANRGEITEFKNQGGVRESVKTFALVLKEAELLVSATKIAYHTHSLGLEQGTVWLRVLVNSLHAYGSENSQFARDVFGKELAKSIDARTYLRFVGDVAIEQGLVSLGYVLWSEAGFDSGTHFLEKKYPAFVRK